MNNESGIMNQGDKNKILRIIIVSLSVLMLGIAWLLTLKYNLQGGFRKKIDTAKPVQASGQLDEIEMKIKTLKENFKTSQNQINELIKKEK